MNKQESYKIQVLRGLAIIAVVFIHNIPEGISQVFFRPFVNFSVGLFLFLSGMLSSADKWNPIRRIKKVVIPYVIWSALYVILYNHDNIKSIPVVLIKNLITGKAAPMMYYIFIYCSFTLIIPVVDKLAKSRYKYLGFIIAPVEIIIMRSFPVIFGYEINNYVRIIMSISCLGWFTYYYLGYLLGNKIIKIKKIDQKQLFFCFAVSIIIQIAEGYFYYLKSYTNCGTQLKLSAILTGTIVCISAYEYVYSSCQCSFKLLYYLGNASFGIYFSHMAVMYCLQKIPYYTSLMFIIRTIITIVITYALVFIGRKILGKSSKYLAL